MDRDVEELANVILGALTVEAPKLALAMRNAGLKPTFRTYVALLTIAAGIGVRAGASREDFLAAATDIFEYVRRVQDDRAS